MNLKNTLEIILVTYNRKEHLQNTFDQIFAENSPIKNLDITILDNKSTDGTTELIQEYVKKFPNIKHVIHNRNIGGNANIARAFEIASQKYVWILCDDDEYDWTYWHEVEQAIENDYDAVVVANYLNPKKDVAQLVKQLTFVPAGIYKTENITDTVMVNAEFNLSNMFAQLAITCHLINENKKIYICDNWIVNMVPHGGEETYTRGLDGAKHPLMSNMLWHVGFINSMHMIKDAKQRSFIIDKVSLHKNWVSHYYYFFAINEKIANNSFKNICDIFCGMNFRQKFFFLLIFIIFKITNRIIYIKLDSDKIKFKFFGVLKTHIRFKPKQVDSL